MLTLDRYSGAAGTLCDMLCGVDYVAKLREALCGLFGRDTVPLSSADGALHAALFLCGVKPGDYVFVPTRTYYTAIATVTSVGGVPVFIDSDMRTRCMSADALETALLWAKLQGKLPAAVVIDDGFGAVPDYNTLIPLCKSYGLPVVELAGDALGGGEKTPCGSNGDYGVIGFEKRLHGGGGALVCGDDSGRAEEFARLRYSDGESRDYRMHNAVAALDFALLPELHAITARARNNYAALSAAANVVLPMTAGDAASYAPCAALPAVAEMGYTVRRLPPVHTMPKYRGAQYFEHEQGFSASEALAEYMLIDMDMPALKNRRLISKLKTLRK